jgi:two-component system sensor histidine kinase/response regulator
VLQLAGDAIFIADPAGRFVMLNERACDLVGYSRGALLGLDFTALLDPEELRAKPLRVSELRAARSVVVERAVVHRDGTRVPVEIGATLLPGGYVQAIVRDLRPRRDAADALRRSEAILRAVTEHLPDIVVVHREGRVVYVNPAAARAWDHGEGDGLVGARCSTWCTPTSALWWPRASRRC